jgi:hypothetical protein
MTEWHRPSVDHDPPRQCDDTVDPQAAAPSLEATKSIRSFCAEPIICSGRIWVLKRLPALDLGYIR